MIAEGLDHLGNAESEMECRTIFKCCMKCSQSQDTVEGLDFFEMRLIVLQIHWKLLSAPIPFLDASFQLFLFTTLKSTKKQPL
jgi:hypothetical protein